MKRTKRLLLGGVVVMLSVVTVWLYWSRASRIPSPSGKVANPLAATPVEVYTNEEPGLSVMIPDRLLTVFGMSRQMNFSDRNRAVKSLGINLSNDEIEGLYSYLKGTWNSDSQLDNMEINALKNDIVNILRSQRTRPEDLAEHLVNMSRDSSQDPIWNDYCMQQMGAWFPDAGNDDQRLMEDVLWEICRDKTSERAGTALLALFKNVPSGLIRVDDVSRHAEEIVENWAGITSAKVTALQVCALLGNTNILSQARHIAVTEADVQMRMSALAALGTLGISSDRIVLETYSTNQEVRLRTAAQSALRRMDARLTEQSSSRPAK